MCITIFVKQVEEKLAIKCEACDHFITFLQQIHNFITTVACMIASIYVSYGTKITLKSEFGLKVFRYCYNKRNLAVGAIS